MENLNQKHKAKRNKLRRFKYTNRTYIWNSTGIKGERIFKDYNKNHEEVYELDHSNQQLHRGSAYDADDSSVE